MTRKEFLQMCALLGVGMPLSGTVQSCSDDDNMTESNQKVIIIGAGAGGLTSGHLLRQRGVEFEILEASSNYGGRMKRTTEFANFPIPLGGEWLHVERGIFSEIVNDSSVAINVQTTPYNPDVDFGIIEGQRISVEDVGFTIDQKFINSTWFDFFEEYVVPSVSGSIRYNTVVSSIDYSGERIIITTNSGTFEADKVIVNVPVKLLQQNTIEFIPSLPNDKQEAINNVTVWDGCKAFISFSEKFYPTFTAFNITPESDGQKLYYDAAYGQQTDENILGLFAVGTGTLPYVQLSDSDLIDFMLAELDDIFDGQASRNYIKHIFQNWNKEPYAQGAYIYDEENWRRVRTLGQSVDSKVYFAGDAYTTGDDWSSVHAAGRSAIRAVSELLG